jgi:hypothetical protein
MAARLRAVLAACCLAAGAGAAHAADSVILIDHSGSMVSYYRADMMRPLITRIIAASTSSTRPDLVLFAEQTTRIDGLDAPNFNQPKGDTNLRAALDHALRYSRIWVVTDNVQDVDGSHDMSAFYTALQQPRVRDVVVFPLLQKELSSAGLLIYAISTVSSSEPIDAEVVRFKQSGGGSEMTELLMKPLSMNAIVVTQDDKDRPLAFTEGDHLYFESRVRIGARYPHLYFERSPARGAQSVSPFAGERCLVSEKNEAKIDPSYVQTSTEGVYKVSVDFGRVRLRRTLGCYVEAAFGRSSVSEEIVTPVQIEVPRGNLRLSNAYLAKFTASTPAEAKQTGRVFGFGRLPEFLAEPVTLVPLKLPRRVRITYRPWPAIALLLAAIAIVAAAGFGGRAAYAALTNRGTSVTAQTLTGRKLEAAVRRGDVVVSGRVVGRINGVDFRPTSGVRLDPEALAAPLNAPMTCILTDGARVVLTFDDHVGGTSASPQESGRPGSGGSKAGRSPAAGATAPRTPKRR